MKWIEEVNKEDDKSNQILSFNEYMDIFEKTPHQELRTTAMYLKSTFDHFGRNEKEGFNLFIKNHAGSPPVYGQERTQKYIYNNLKNFIEEGFNNKFLLLVGPNGSSKSSLVKKIMLGAQDYSLTDEGALHTFSWIFPIDNYIKGSLGLASKSKSKELNSFAKLDDVEITAILTSELKDHPLLLLPIETRRKMIDSSMAESPAELESIQKSYLYNGDLSKRNRLIFDALLKSYGGDYLEVFKHIRVERFFINKRYSQGATTIEPQLHVDAKMIQITMDRRLASLPPSLQSLNLFNLQGEVVLANRGILEYSDLLKRPLDSYKYLLMTMESRSINLQGILTELDTFFIGSSNEIHFDAFKQHPDFNSFKGRFNFLKVPYLLDYKDEMGIYNEQVDNVKDKCHFEPHALETFSLWSVMTRIRPGQAKNYKDKKLGAIVEKLNPLEKTLFLADSEVPERLTSEEKQNLLSQKSFVVSEYFNDQVYEGKFGISPRELKQAIYEISLENTGVTFIDIIEYLRVLGEKKMQFDFLNMPPQGDYHNPHKYIYLIEQHCLNRLDNELRDALGLVDNRSYEEYIRKYILSINAIIKGEKVKNKLTGKYETSDMYFITEFEKNIDLKESPDKFRSYLISKLGAFYLDNPGIEIVYSTIFDNLTKKLQEGFRKEQKVIIDKIAANLVFYQTKKEREDNKKEKLSINEEARELLSNVISSLQSKHKYTEMGALNLIRYIISKRYDKKPS
jgi:serine protein kinase